MQKEHQTAIHQPINNINKLIPQKQANQLQLSQLKFDESDQNVTKIVTDASQRKNIKNMKKKGIFSNCLKCYAKNFNNGVVQTPIITIASSNQIYGKVAKPTTPQDSLEIQKKLVTQVQQRHEQYVVSEKLIYDDDDENIIQQSDTLHIKTQQYDTTKHKSDEIILKTKSEQLEKEDKELSLPQVKKLLILDLDETLVHSTFTDDEIKHSDFQLSIKMDDGQNITYNIGVFERPFLKEFLLEASKYFTIWIFTASLQIYCDAVMAVIDPDKLCKRRLYRQDCKIVGQQYFKDISNFGYSLKDVILMDNSEISFGLQPENGLLCPDFFSNKSDTYLRDILPILRKLAVCKDVREILEDLQ